MKLGKRSVSTAKDRVRIGFCREGGLGYLSVSDAAAVGGSRPYVHRSAQ